jgi:hypothetical protein
MRHVINVGGISNVYKSLIIKPDGRNPIGRLAITWRMNGMTKLWTGFICACVRACVRVCACVCERERERERARASESTRA